MAFLFFFFFFLLSSAHESKVKHVVILMLENNSFERFFGVRMNQTRHCNVDAHGKQHCQRVVDSLVPGCDPDHGLSGTTKKIFGYPPNYHNATMGGFYEEEEKRGEPDGCGVLDILDSKKSLPVMDFLADEYALFDRFFASVPGPTWPNRFFSLMGTSGGSTGTGEWYGPAASGGLYPQRTIMDQVADAGLSWANVFQTTPWELPLASILHNPENLWHYDKFLAALKSGDSVPNYVWLNPRSGIDGDSGYGSNDGHPDHDLALSEAFVKQLYEAVRASPVWNETALIVTMDEHGGFFDSVPTPLNVPPPDKLTKEFSFDRLGVRLPFLVVSPYVKRGTVVSTPPASQKPAPNSEFELTSLIATTRVLLNISEGPLTARDAWTARFDHVFELNAPRSDCPLKAPPAPPASPPIIEYHRPLNHLQQEIVQFHERASKRVLKRPKKQGHLHHFLRRHFAHALERVRREDEAFELLVNDDNGGVVEDQWVIDQAAKRIKSASLNSSGIPYCFTASSEAVTVSICRNAQKEQQFEFHTNGAIVYSPSQQCVTVAPLGNLEETFGNWRVFLKACDDSIYQSFSFYGETAPSDRSSSIYFGDVAAAFVVQEKKKKK